MLKEVSSKVPLLGHSFVRRWNLDISERWSEIPGKFWNVVLEKDGEDPFDRSMKNEVLHRVKDERNILLTIHRRKANWVGHILCMDCLLRCFFEGKIEGMIEVTERRGRRCKQLLYGLKGKRGCWKLSEGALDRTLWRTRFGRGGRPGLRQTKEWMNIRKNYWILI